MRWQIGRVIRLRLYRRLGYPLIGLLLLSLTFTPGVTAWLLTRCGRDRRLGYRPGRDHGFGHRPGRDHGLGYRPGRRLLSQLLEMCPYLFRMTSYRGLFVESIIYDLKLLKLYYSYQRNWITSRIDNIKEYKKCSLIRCIVSYLYGSGIILRYGICCWNWSSCWICGGALE